VGGAVVAGAVSGVVAGAVDGVLVGVVARVDGVNPFDVAGPAGVLPVVGVEGGGTVVDGVEPESLPRMSPMGPLSAEFWRGTENGFDG
jgi:hypothetical protein